MRQIQLTTKSITSVINKWSVWQHRCRQVQSTLIVFKSFHALYNSSHWASFIFLVPPFLIFCPYYFSPFTSQCDRCQEWGFMARRHGLTSHGCCAKSGSSWTSQTLNLHQALQFFNLYCTSLKLRIKMKNICKKRRLPSVSYGELHQPWPYALQHQCFQPSLWFQQQM